MVSYHRKQTILLALACLLVVLCVQVLATPDMGFTHFTDSPLSRNRHESESQSQSSEEQQYTPHDSTPRVVDISFNSSFYVLSWGLRFVLGIPLGILLVTAILYTSELPLPQERGYYMAYLPLAYLAGIWLALLITLVLHHHMDTNDTFAFLSQSLSFKKEQSSEFSLAIHILGNEWRWHLVIPFLCCVALLVGFQSVTNWLILSPESPYWLLANDSTTIPSTSLTSTSTKKKIQTQTTRRPPMADASRKPTAETSMDAFTSLLLIRGGGKTPLALREVSLEFANMYRALAQDAVSEQSWRDLCLGTSDISQRYRLLLLWLLMAVQVFLGPFLLFKMSRWFSLLLLGRDPYMLGGDDDDSRHYQVC